MYFFKTKLTPTMAIFISSAAQISIQEPLSEAWMHSTVQYTQRHAQSIDPEFRNFVVSKDFRRLGKLVKRAITTSHEALRLANCSQPDAIISGTGVGCTESTEKFLLTLIGNNETCLTPTHFIYSTHNTISSQIALSIGCQGYNNTYSQQGTSFESALFDAYIQFQTKRISSAMVGGFDEMTPSYFQLLDQLSFWGNPNSTAHCIAGESAVSMLLSNLSTHALCRIDGMELLYRPTEERFQKGLQHLLQSSQLSLSDIDTLVVGTNGIPSNDIVYQNLYSQFSNNLRVVNYKSIFGEGYTLSALGVYASAMMLHHQFIPRHLLNRGDATLAPKHLLFYNHFQNRHHALILLSSC